ncbi:MAG: hypothetical protein A3F53_01900 [Candidatus Zambryskibacteria bacterium RIFCSPHIGHO2_12_FULL_48_10]|uniref:Uncharacterized protein n=1 Tax=Candidatus Zambryskibacteria bacterium RIFCSPHIGHO2_01_FULL_46_25 TaxID=1802738 RepID=A0A1G2T0S2_9BACT|nr:MAG: hypothetical protein A2838_02455 [Candidatus Zambryskibacteria bacterium RIFCSPHIGHO2_01_FULL_46_25]OHB00574.1 MAG: hypothetical protein A3F53_01900 [Candidatus Zambryskibacteria bacterium RIFCSPHIGHO2_12_FULL_48_10]OHB06967.1 MAG: hypothetical protein A3A31_01590 [Candidatus Zambryskibacteria bacterium RIFCSPLOWO2_01_FULL_48_25]
MAMPGWQSLIVCDGVKTTELPECGYASLITLARVLINDLFILSTLIAVAAFAYAGFKMVMSRGSETEYKNAVTMLSKVAWGYVWILAAWLVVYTISTVLLKSNFIILK